MEILIPEVESYLEGIICVYSLGDISEKLSQKLENVDTTLLKNTKNINIFFL